MEDYQESLQKGSYNQIFEFDIDKSIPVQAYQDISCRKIHIIKF